MLCRVGRLAMLLRAVPCHLLPLWGDEQFPFFSSSSSFWEQRRQRQPVERGVLFPSLPFISLLIRQSILLADSGARCLPACPARPLHHPPGSRCGRPVSAKPIGKQRLKMYFPVSFPSSTSKHSNRSRKNAVRPQFLLTMIYYHFASRPPPRKFDKSQNL